MTRFVAATSSARELNGFCTATTCSPFASSNGITRFQLDPSANAPCTRTILVPLRSAGVAASAVCNANSPHSIVANARMVLKLLVIVLPLNTALSIDVFLMRQPGAPLRRMRRHASVTEQRRSRVRVDRFEAEHVLLRSGRLRGVATRAGTRLPRCDAAIRRALFSLEARQRGFDVLRILRVVARRVVAGLLQLDQLGAHLRAGHGLVRLRERHSGSGDQGCNDEGLNEFHESFSSSEAGLR